MARNRGGLVVLVVLTCLALVALWPVLQQMDVVPTTGTVAGTITDLREHGTQFVRGILTPDAATVTATVFHADRIEVQYADHVESVDAPGAAWTLSTELAGDRFGVMAYGAPGPDLACIVTGRGRTTSTVEAHDHGSTGHVWCGVTTAEGE